MLQSLCVSFYYCNVSCLTQGEFEHLLPSAVHDAEFVMSFLKSVYEAIAPLVFSAGEKPGLFALFKFFGASIGLFLLLDGLSKVPYCGVMHRYQLEVTHASTMLWCTVYACKSQELLHTN